MADPSCSTSKCFPSLSAFGAHVGFICVGNKSLFVFPFVRQMEGHRHHSAQQVGHHRGDNKQRRHYHFSHGECFVWSLHTRAHTHTLVDILARVAKVCSGKWNIVRYRCDYNRIKYRRLLFVCFYLQEDMEMAKYIARLFTARHKFYKQNKICAEWVRRP